MKIRKTPGSRYGRHLVGSIAVSLLLAGAGGFITWSDRWEGFAVEAIMVGLLWIPYFLVLGLVEAGIALVDKRFPGLSRSRFVAVWFPSGFAVVAFGAALLSLSQANYRQEIERSARRPLPADIGKIKRHYSGGFNSSSTYRFTVSEQGFEDLAKGRDYQRQVNRDNPDVIGCWGDPEVEGRSYYLFYSKSTKWCRFSIMN